MLAFQPGEDILPAMDKAHSNVFVRNLPPSMDRADLKKLFGVFGNVLSVRILEPQQVGQQRLGFVKFASLEEAQAGIKSLHKSRLGKHVLEVKLADSDIGPQKLPVTAPALAPAAGLGFSFPMCGPVRGVRSENDNLVVTGFSGYWRDADLADLFLSVGIVVEARVLASPGGDPVGLVRFSCVEEARQAVDAFDGRFVKGCGPLRVEFAGGFELEREAERLQFAAQRTPSSASSHGVSSSNSLTCSASLLRDLDTSCDSAVVSNACMVTDRLRELSPIAAELSAQRQLQELIHKLSDSLDVHKQSSSVYVAKLPQDTDRLFLYEKFAPFGAVSSVRVLLDEKRKCTGVGFVNFVEPSAAKRAVLALNGARVAGRDLQVRLQEGSRRR